MSHGIAAIWQAEHFDERTKSFSVTHNMRMSLLFFSLSSLSISAQAADDVVTLPLVPHHVIARRRRALTETSVNRYTDAEEKERRYEQYQARSMSFFSNTGSTKNDSAEQTAKQVSVIYQGYGVSRPAEKRI
jgi:hypothetical protein